MCYVRIGTSKGTKKEHAFDLRQGSVAENLKRQSHRSLG